MEQKRRRAMVKMAVPLTEEETRKLTMGNLRKEYLKLADTYKKILNEDLIYCPHCKQWKKVNTEFYSSDTSPGGVERFACRDCIINMCVDTDSKTGSKSDNKEKTVDTFRRLNWYFNERIYDEQVKKVSEQKIGKVRSTGVQQLIVMIKSLPKWKGFTFKDSEFLDVTENGIQAEMNRKPRPEIIKLFGNFPTEDLLYLQDQYDDWCLRTEVSSKSQQTYIIRICFKLLDIYKAQKEGKDTAKLDDSLNNLLAAANLQPRQNVGNASTDALTFGQLIEKWEEEDPILIPKEYEDIDNLSKYINVWFKGGLSRALNLDNGYSKEYDDYISEYTVNSPEYVGDDTGGDESVYAKIFGVEDK